MDHIKEDYNQQDNAVKDLDILLKDVDLKECCQLIEANAHLYEELQKLRHEASELDSQVDLIKIKIGELDIDAALADYEQQKEEMYEGFESISKKGQMLRTYCKEYEEYASDKEEKELIIDTEQGIEGFLRSVNSKQAELVDD